MGCNEISGFFVIEDEWDIPKAFLGKIKVHKVIQSSAGLTLSIRKIIKLLVQKRLLSSHSVAFIVLQSKPAAIIHKLLTKMRTIKQSAHWARGGTWRPCCFLPVNLSISDGQKIDPHSPAYVYVVGGTWLFIPFWQAKKKLKPLWKKLDLQGKYAPTSTQHTWEEYCVF